MAFKAGQQSYWQTRECLAISFQSHLIGGTESGWGNWEIEEKTTGRCHYCGFLRQLSQILLRGEQRFHLGEEFLPGTSRGKYLCPRQLSSGADRGTVGQAVESTAMVLLQRWEEGSALLWCAWWTCLGVEMDFSCPRFGNEVKIRLNPHKKWEVSGEVFCCLILWKQSGNCTPGSCCEIAATDKQNWDRYFYLDFRVPEMQISILFHPIPLCKQFSLGPKWILSFGNPHSHTSIRY